MGDARGAGAGASLTGRAMGLGFGRAGAGACAGFGLDGAGAWATRFFGLVGAGAGAGLAIFLKPGGFATGAFRAAGAFAARLAYTPSVYWPLGAAFSLSLPRRTRALGAGLLAACGLAPPALGFTLAAVVGIAARVAIHQCAVGSSERPYQSVYPAISTRSGFCRQSSSRDL